jgi:hypothetical protein
LRGTAFHAKVSILFGKSLCPIQGLLGGEMKNVRWMALGGLVLAASLATVACTKKEEAAPEAAPAETAPAPEAAPAAAPAPTTAAAPATGATK